MMNFTSHIPFKRRFFRAALLCLLATTQFIIALGQDKPPEPEDAEGVLRISTSLVQTDVSVVDRKGQFVEGLQRDQFELKVDGQIQPVLFFERVTAGSANEAARLAAARGETIAVAGTAAVERGRSLIFFVDDLHLSPEGIVRARKLLLNFIDTEMTPNTQTLIASSSGQIGFLQQFTNDREALRAAVKRLNYVSQASYDIERPPMSAYLALAIERGDRSATQYMMRQMQAPETVVQNRASRIRRQAALLSGATVAALEGVVSTRSPLPGRQALFFISEGFPLDTQEADINYKLQRMTDAAARTGTVAYTLDARGLSVGMIDASSEVRPDFTGGYNSMAELSSSQEVLRAIAADTGGRALLNTNALEAAVSKTLSETANYYVLAWRPEERDAAGGAPKFRKIKITVKDRPELTVRVRRGFLNAPAVAAPATAARNTTTATNPVKVALNAALNAPVIRRELQVDAYPIFTNEAQGGSVLTAPVQVAKDRLQFAENGGKSQAVVEMACIVLDDKGKVVFSEGKTLTLTGNASNANAPDASPIGGRGKVAITFAFPVSAPGLYQFRVAARDSRNGLVGSVFRWVEVPDLKAKRMALSSLFLIETRRRAGAASPDASETSATAENVLKADRRFARSSRLLLQFHIYNAARQTNGSGAPDVEVEIKIIDSNNNALMSTPPSKVSLAGATDLSRIPYAADVALGRLPAGVYQLQVAVTDRVGRTTTTRQIDFAVE